MQQCFLQTVKIILLECQNILPTQEYNNYILQHHKDHTLFQI